MDLSDDILIALIVQGFTLIGTVVTIVLTARVKKKADSTELRVERTEAHAARAAEDSSVVRSETRNHHDPDRNMRHDLDQVLANQEDSKIERRAFEKKVISKLEGHDREFQVHREDNVVQWAAINASNHLANEAATAAAEAARAVANLAITTGALRQIDSK